MLKLTLCHLFPEFLSAFGDSGDILALIKRCKWRNINVDIIKYNVGDEVDLNNVDIFYMNGEADSRPSIDYKDRVCIKQQLETTIEEGKAFLAVCGGYQLLGRYCLRGEEANYGLGLLDFHTVSSRRYFTGNAIVDICGYHLIGLENHTGKTYLNGLKPLGQVISGFGNNGADGTEGIRYKNLIGTYLHGPLLPKNPKLCDELISIALKNKYIT